MRKLLYVAMALLLLPGAALSQTLSLPPSIQVQEGQTWYAPVVRSGPKGTTASFQYNTSDLTAKAGVDYVARSGRQSVRRNASRYTLSGSTINDTVYKGDRAFRLNITAISGATIAQGSTVITILEDDPKPPTTPTAGTPTVNHDPRNCAEAAGRCVSYVWRNNGVFTSPSVLNWSTKTGGTATAGADYTASSGTITIPAGQQGGSFSFPVNNDATDENNETVLIELTPVSNVIIGSAGPITIVDDDTAPPPPVPCPDGSTVPAGQTCPTVPPPSGVNDNVLIIAGDSISVHHPGNYSGTYCAARPSVSCRGIAVGGTGLVTMQPQFDQAMNIRGEVFAILPGANDLGDTIRYPTVDSYLNYLFSKTDPIRALGTKILVGTTLWQANNPPHNARLAEVRSKILAAVGTKIDGSFDVGDPAWVMYGDTSKYLDGVHPTYSCGFDCGGQGYMATRFAAQADKLLGFPPTTPPPPPPPTTGLSAKANSNCRSVYSTGTTSQATDGTAMPTFTNLISGVVYPVVARALTHDNKRITALNTGAITTYFPDTCITVL